MGFFMNDLLADFRRRGFSLLACEGTLIVRPASRLTPQDRDVLKADREALLDALDLEAAALTVDTFVAWFSTAEDCEKWKRGKQC